MGLESGMQGLESGVEGSKLQTTHKHLFSKFILIMHSLFLNVLLAINLNSTLNQMVFQSYHLFPRISVIG